MIGLASSPGTAVLPTWWMPPTTQSPIASSSAARSSSNRVDQDGSYPESRIGSSAANGSGGRSGSISGSSLSDASRRARDRSDSGYGESVKRALLLDLDETLMVEEPAAEAAFLASAQLAAAEQGADPQALATDARARARELWYAAPTHAYCMRVGISSWEGLWCRFEGDHPDVRALRDWSSTYRREAWSRALADQEVEDGQLAEDLAERFIVERRGRHEVFADVADGLERLAESHAMALVTNGAACLQREKLTASGLSEHFEAVIVSADVGVAKPDSAIFEHALSELGVCRDRAVMVGDSIAKDVDGALAAGLDAVWVNRSRHPLPPDRPDLVEISTLGDLPDALDSMR